MAKNSPIDELRAQLREANPGLDWKERRGMTQGPMMTEEHLEMIEQRARASPLLVPFQDVVRLVAEVRRLRHHLMVLETDGDPAGTATEAMLGRDTIRALGLKLAECRAEERERCARLVDEARGSRNATENLAETIRALQDE